MDIRPDDYVPPWWLQGGHRMTLFVYWKRRQFPCLPPAEDRIFEVAPDARVLGRCHWQPEPRRHPTLLLLHGLEGSAGSPYMKGLAEKAWLQGANVVRLNQRNCGGTEHLSRTLYHSGLSEDPAAVVNELVDVDKLNAIAIIGFSLGGNLALRLAGVWGAQAPAALKAVCAVSPPIELAACADAMERPENALYQWNFVRHLKQRLRRKAALFPDLYTTDGLNHICSVRQFDDRYTAPHFGFRDSADYYHRASARRVVDRIRVPTLIISAADDPFIPVAPLVAPEVKNNEAVTVVITRRGGHCGFVARRTAGSRHDGFWAEEASVAFALAHARGW